MLVSERCHKYGVGGQYDNSSADAEDQGMSPYGPTTTFAYIVLRECPRQRLRKSRSVD
jgi:hypothetical protein